MRQIIRYLQFHPMVLFYFALALIPFALLINLGLVPVIFVPDESIRGLVSLEMMFSGNYITPTINGEFYYNKPPLFNWLIVGLFKLTGNQSLFVMRLITVIGLMLFSFTIYHFLSKHYSKQFALFNVLMFVTCGRILLWDSFIALIDITFSWIIYLNWMIIYHLNGKKNYLKLFVVSYSLISIAFLMKALPALAFQGISLLVFFIYNRNFKRLLHWHHFAGIFVLVVIVGGYYLLYSQYNTLDVLIPNIFNESGKRTVLRFGWLITLKHIFTFPFEQLYHFAPWSLLIVFLFSGKVFKHIFSDSFLKFNFLMFAFNIIIYWTSPEVHPRFILMMAPLVFLIFAYFAILRPLNSSYFTMGVEAIFLIVGIIATLGVWYVPFFRDTKDIPLVWVKVAILSMASGFFTFLFYKIKKQRMVIFVILMLLLRLGFDWFAFPPRAKKFKPYSDNAEYVGNLTKNSNLYLYKETVRDDPNSFYLTRSRGQIVKIANNHDDKNAFYLSEEKYLEGEQYEVFYEYRIFSEKRRLLLVKFLE